MKELMAVMLSSVLLVGSGAVMAMDSEYLEKRRATMQVQQEKSLGESDVISQPGRKTLAGPEKEIGLATDENDELTHEALRYWWL